MAKNKWQMANLKDQIKVRFQRNKEITNGKIPNFKG